MDTKQLITIVITVVVTEIVRRLASFVSDKLKTITEKEKAKRIFKALFNWYMVLLLMQIIAFMLMTSVLKTHVQSDAKVTNHSVFQMMLIFTFTLRVGYNSLRALRDYINRTRELYKSDNIANQGNTPA
jgi:uncharacterized membrane protein